MCATQECVKWHQKKIFLFSIAILLSVLAAYSRYTPLIDLASFIASLSMRLLKLISIPILFFSLMSVFSSLTKEKGLTRTIFMIAKYTCITTLIAAAIALFCAHSFSLLSKAKIVATFNDPSTQSIESEISQFHYSEWILKTVPVNFIDPFMSNNAIAALFIALLLGGSLSTVPEIHREMIHKIVQAVYALLLQTTLFIVQFLPIMLWAFITLLLSQIPTMGELTPFFRYFMAIICANLIQGFIVIPLLLKKEQISPLKLAQSFSPALAMAFATKSSSATVPLAIQCATTRASIRESTAALSFPLCTSINMNGCAAFILITVLFIGSMHGAVFTPLDQSIWIAIATLAAIGNAGVPMGCYFLSCALLASMDIPLSMMGVILPFYAIIDAIETTLNVWSDCSITAIVDKKSDENRIG